MGGHTIPESSYFLHFDSRVFQKVFHNYVPKPQINAIFRMVVKGMSVVRYATVSEILPDIRGYCTGLIASAQYIGL